MEKAGSLHASVPTPPPRLYLPRHFSCSACLYGGLGSRCKGGCSPEPEPLEALPNDDEEEEEESSPPPPPPPRSPSPPSSPSPSRGREPTLPLVPPSPTLRRRAKSLPTPGNRSLRPALQQQSPSRRKTVRFADALGLELTSVRHFSQQDVPRVPSPPPLPASPFPFFSPSDLFKTRKPPTLGDLEPVLFGPPAPILEPLFPPAPGSSAGFAERVKQGKVRLEWVRAEAGGLRGSVRVLNLAYEKAVSVRYTLNRWASCSEVTATFQAPSSSSSASSDGTTDRFAFLLPVGPGTTQLEFALRYRVDGAEFWDNNGGKNYRMRGRQRTPAASGNEPDAWIHFI
ncbi:protein phosphatase 1 regulatory subunit 3E-like [Anolis sagrei]|uniref:protein phosphatase 1 regulatory subunit 3E-like n=1 Tax=Anolis sagrei TaxID=38937 RepID=UPI0035203231